MEEVRTDLTLAIKEDYVDAAKEYLAKMGIDYCIGWGILDMDKKFVPFESLPSFLTNKMTHAQIEVLGLKPEEMDNIEAGIYTALLDKKELDRSRVPLDLTDR